MFVSNQKAIAALFNVDDQDAKGQMQAVAMSLMHPNMVRKVARQVFDSTRAPNKKALAQCALSDSSEIASFLSTIQMEQSTGLYSNFEEVIGSRFPESKSVAPGLFMYLYLMHGADASILSQLASESDMGALDAELKSFYTTYIDPDTPSQIVSNVSSVIAQMGVAVQEPEPVPEPVPEPPQEPEPVPEPVTKPSVTIKGRPVGDAYSSSNIVEEFRKVVGLEACIDTPLVGQLLLAMYMPEKVMGSKAYKVLSHKLRLRPHQESWAKTYAVNHPDLTSGCWTQIMSSLGQTAEEINGMPFVQEMSTKINMPCYASAQDAVVCAMSMTQFNYMSIVGAVLGQMTQRQIRNLRANRATYMAGQPVDQLCQVFELSVLPARA